MATKPKKKAKTKKDPDAKADMAMIKKVVKQSQGYKSK